MDTKSDKLRALVKAEKWEEAFKLAKSFKLGFTKNEQADISRAHEIKTNVAFYKRLGFDEFVVKQKAIDVLKKHYGE